MLGLFAEEPVPDKGEVDDSSSSRPTIALRQMDRETALQEDLRSLINGNVFEEIYRKPPNEHFPNLKTLSLRYH